MLFYLDTCIVIYAVEGQPPFKQRAQTHIAALETTGHSFVLRAAGKNDRKPQKTRQFRHFVRTLLAN